MAPFERALATSYRLSIVTFPLSLRVSEILPLLFSSTPPQIAHVGVSQSRGLKVFGREVILEEFQPMSSRYMIVTDRETDRRTDRRKQSQYRAMH